MTDRAIDSLPVRRLTELQLQREIERIAKNYNEQIFSILTKADSLLIRRMEFKDGKNLMTSDLPPEVQSLVDTWVEMRDRELAKFVGETAIIERDDYRY